ncbi:glycosyltransferase [bacterium]|nr:glycosyltransferase [bacterium]
MKILAGPDNWSYFTKYWAQGLADEELLTFSQGNGGIQYQPGRSCFKDILAQLPPGWEPDLVIWWFPEFQELLPDLVECPYPTMVQISDWHAVRDGLVPVCQHFDLVATDRMGLDVLAGRHQLAFEAPLYGFDPEVHRRLPECEKIFDVSHVGDLNPYLHDRRVRMLARAAQDLGQGRVIRYFSGLEPDNYAWVLNQSRITINHALRGEASMRCFEALACGSLLFCEEDNAGARAVLGEHCVYYNPDNLSQKLRYFLEHEQERADKVEAGWQHIQQFTYRKQGQRLMELVRQRLPQVDRARRIRSSLLGYWGYTVNKTRPAAVAYQQSHQALENRPQDPELLNLRGCLEARIGAGLGMVDQRLGFFQDARQHLSALGNWNCLALRSLSQVHWMVCEPVEAAEALERAVKAPFLEAPFFPREVGPLHVLWEREPARREANTRWQIHDMLAQVRPQQSLEHCRKALQYRPEAAISWFRLALELEPGSPERLKALRDSCRFDPIFAPALLALAEELVAHGLRGEFDEWVTSCLNVALAFPQLSGLKNSLMRLLIRMANPVESPQPASLEDFLKGISFAWLQPDQPIPFQLRDRMGTLWERHNTRFTHGGKDILRRFSELEDVPRMSTLAYSALLQRMVAEMPDHLVYVNVGVWHGFSFLASILDNGAKRCVGVDNFSQFGGPRAQFLQRFERLRGDRHEFYEMDYQDYFAHKHTGQLGAYFYDGHHAYEHQLRGLQVAEPHFAPGCIVLVDDTNWDEPRQASLDFVKNSSRRYELIFDMRTALNSNPTWWNGFHPTWWNGVMIWRCLE